MQESPMTQRQLENAVADATGESLGLVRGLGFRLVAPGRDGLEREDPVLAVLCPSCRRSVAYPGPVPDGSLPLAECLGCDLYFGVTSTEIPTTPPGCD